MQHHPRKPPNNGQKVCAVFLSESAHKCRNLCYPFHAKFFVFAGLSRVQEDRVRGFQQPVVFVLLLSGVSAGVLSDTVAPGRRAQCRAAGWELCVLCHRAGRSVGVLCAAGRICAGQLRAGACHHARQAARKAVAHRGPVLQFPVAVPI